MSEKQEVSLDLTDALFYAKINNNKDYAWKRIKSGPFTGHRVEVHADRFHSGVYKLLQFDAENVQTLERLNLTTEEVSLLGVSYGPEDWEPGEDMQENAQAGQGSPSEGADQCTQVCPA